MSIAKRMGRKARVLRTRILLVGLGLSLFACQSDTISLRSPTSQSKSADSAGESQGNDNPTDDKAITDEASTAPATPALSHSALSTNASLADGSNLNSEESTSATVLDAVLPDQNDGSENPTALALANHLTQMGAQMFGAYWCPHCREQKKQFGEAFSAVDYVECDPGGENPRTQLCLDHDIEAFPTWIINGEHHLGAYSLGELAELSGYEGDV